MNNFTLNNSNGVSLSTSPTIDGTLTFTSGKITTGSSQVNIANTSSSAVSGAGTGKYVYGTVQKSFANGSGQSFTFPVGDSSVYAPVAITSLQPTGSGSHTITVKTTSGDHPNIATSGINSTVSVNRYWTLTEVGSISGTYNVGFNYVSGDLDGGTTPSTFVVKKYSSSVWSSATVSGTPTNTLTNITGQSGSGDFAIGNTAPADTTPPSASPVTISSNNTNSSSLAKAGDTVTLSFTASEQVRTPVVTISGHSVSAATSSGNSFTASYVMGSQSGDTDGTIPFSITLTDSAGNAASAVTAITTGSNVTYDKTAPTVTNITSDTADGSYKAGKTIKISIAFSESVNVSGTPTLVLSDGGTATYESGTGGSTLVYTYTVSSGENSSDLGVSSVGSGISDAAGNAANTSIPSGHNLSDNGALVIDTTAPTVSSVVTDAPSNPTNHSSLTVTVTFSESVTDFDTTTVLDVSTNNGTIGNPVVVDSSHYRFDVTGYTEGDVTVHPGAVQDLAGNLNSADGSVSVTYDTQAPNLQITQEPIINGYASSTALSFDFTTDAASTSCQFDADYTSGCTSPFATTTAEGAHTLTIVGQDVAGNTTSVVRNFTVDVTPPTVSTAADMTVTATMPTGAVVTYSLPNAHDNFDASVTTALSCSPASSSVFSIGDHAITCVARDAAGNEVDTAPFTTVHVVDLDSGAGLTSIDGTQTNGTANNTYANGWHWTFHFTLPFGETQFSMSFSDFTSGSNSITADNLRFCSEQSNKNCADDSSYVSLTAANATSSPIVLTGDADNTAEGRQVDVKVEVKIPAAAVPGSYSASYGYDAEPLIVT